MWRRVCRQRGIGSCRHFPKVYNYLQLTEAHFPEGMKLHRSKYYPPIYAYVFQIVFFSFRFSVQKYLPFFHTLQPCNMPVPSHFLSFWHLFFLLWLNSPNGPGPTHYRGFMITLRHITLGRIPLDEWSAGRRGLYLTTHNTHNIQKSMPLAGF